MDPRISASSMLRILAICSRFGRASLSCRHRALPSATPDSPEFYANAVSRFPSFLHLLPLRCGDPHWLQDYDHKPKQDP